MRLTIDSADVHCAGYRPSAVHSLPWAMGRQTHRAAYSQLPTQGRSLMHNLAQNALRAQVAFNFFFSDQGNALFSGITDYVRTRFVLFTHIDHYFKPWDRPRSGLGVYSECMVLFSVSKGRELKPFMLQIWRWSWNWAFWDGKKNSTLQHFLQTLSLLVIWVEWDSRQPECTGAGYILQGLMALVFQSIWTFPL